VQEQILPDPASGSESEFWVQRINTFGSDYEVFADSGYTKKWLVIDQQGSLWDSKCKFFCENYVRPDGGKIGDGECLAACVVETPKYDYYGFDWDRSYKFEDSDDSDGYSDDSDGWDGGSVETKQKCKFRVKTKAHFYTDRNLTKKIATCKVKAKGKAKMECSSHDMDVDRKVKVKKFVYKLTVGDEEVPIKMHGSINHSSGSKYGGSNTWKCPGFFKADIKGFFSAKPHIQSCSEGNSNPAMDLLLGFMVANVMAPDNMKNQCCPPFTMRTLGGPGFRDSGFRDSDSGLEFNNSGLEFSNSGFGD